jgi:hypothetical protein
LFSNFPYLSSLFISPKFLVFESFHWLLASKFHLKISRSFYDQKQMPKTAFTMGIGDGNSRGGAMLAMCTARAMTGQLPTCMARATVGVLPR